MYSADITWTPIAEDNAIRRSGPPKDREVASLKSNETRIRRLRWPLSRKSKSSSIDSERKGDSRRSSDTTSVKPGLIPFHGANKESQANTQDAVVIASTVASTAAGQEVRREWTRSPNSEIVRRLESQQAEAPVSPADNPPRNEVFELPASPQPSHIRPESRVSSRQRPPSYVSDISLVTLPLTQYPPSANFLTSQRIEAHMGNVPRDY